MTDLPPCKLCGASLQPYNDDSPTMMHPWGHLPNGDVCALYSSIFTLRQQDQWTALMSDTDDLRLEAGRKVMEAAAQLSLDATRKPHHEPSLTAREMGERIALLIGRLDLPTILGIKGDGNE